MAFIRSSSGSSYHWSTTPHRTRTMKLLTLQNHANTQILHILNYPLLHNQHCYALGRLPETRCDLLDFLCHHRRSWWWCFCYSWYHCHYGFLHSMPVSSFSSQVTRVSELWSNYGALWFSLVLWLWCSGSVKQRLIKFLSTILKQSL